MPSRRDGEPDLAAPTVAADVDWLRRNLRATRFDLSDAPKTALARLLVGVEARRRAGGGDLAIVSCDNLPENGDLTRAAMLSLARLAGAGDTFDHLVDHVTFVSTSIDRITPRTTKADAAAVASATGWRDASPVVTEPFHDWVLSGEFRGGRPDWEAGGARFVDDIDPFERRKLWLLNGAHTLMAYAGSARGHLTVAEAIGDSAVREWVDEFWSEAVAHLPVAGLDLDAYRAALRDRFDNARIQHRLDQIGQDGTTKLRVRIVPVLKAELSRRSRRRGIHPRARRVGRGRPRRSPAARPSGRRARRRVRPCAANARSLRCWASWTTTSPPIRPSSPLSIARQLVSPTESAIGCHPPESVLHW